MNLSFLKQGTEAVQELKNPTISTSAGKVLRFFLRYEQTALLTFLDGALVPADQTDGEVVFDVPGAYEHSLLLNGRVEDFICTLPIEGTCPLCTDRKARYYNVFFTVIDHRRNVSSQGKVYEHNKRIFAVNNETYKKLIKCIGRDLDKNIGLTGMQVTTEKMAKKSSAVGDFFTFECYTDLQALKEKGIDAEPLDFSKELVYRDVETLLRMGFGVGAATPVPVLNGAVLHAPVTVGTMDLRRSQNVVPDDMVAQGDQLVPLDDSIPF